MRNFKIVGFFCLLITVFFGFFIWNKFEKREQRFCPETMMNPIDGNVIRNMQAPLPVKEISEIFSQPFFFLGKGKQCIAYESCDGQYVVKFFKHTDKENKQYKVQESIEGAYIAWTYLSEESALIACSLGDQKLNLPVLTLLNKKGKIEKTDLRSLPFIIQKKAVSLKKTLMKLIADKKEKEAQAILASVFTVLAKCREKKILDKDGSLIRKGNIGCIAGKAVLIDTGKLHLFQSEEKQTFHDLNRLKPLRSWLQKACPELMPSFKVCYEKYSTQGKKYEMDGITCCS